MDQRGTPQGSGFRGVVRLRPGKWGAIITVNRKRIWLGTYEMAVDAAIAYDRVNLKLERYGSLNFPLTVRNYDEIRFQDRYPVESIISMIKIGSYDWTFRNFLSREAFVKTIRRFASIRHGYQHAVIRARAGMRTSGSSHAEQKPVMLFGERIN